jgi:hypothetical protein
MFTFSKVWLIFQKQRLSIELCNQITITDGGGCQCDTVRKINQRLSGINLHCHGLQNFKPFYLLDEALQKKDSNSIILQDTSSNVELEQILKGLKFLK